MSPYPLTPSMVWIEDLGYQQESEEAKLDKQPRFTPPDFESPTGAVIFASALALTTQLFLTVARIPWMAWAIELTSDYDAKTQLTSVRELMRGLAHETRGSFRSTVDDLKPA